MKIPSAFITQPERGSASRSGMINQSRPENSTPRDWQSCCGSQTRAPGFSLVEVIVAVAILSIALVGLVHGISMALASSKEAELQTTASMFAAGLIEELRAEGGVTDGQSQGECGTELPLYRWTASVSAAGIDGLHEVDVSILSTHSAQEIYTLRTLLFEPPPDTDSKKSDSKSKKKSRGTS